MIKREVENMKMNLMRQMVDYNSVITGVCFQVFPIIFQLLGTGCKLNDHETSLYVTSRENNGLSKTFLDLNIV